MKATSIREVYRSPLVWILGLSAVVRLIYMSFNAPLWWDAHIYVGMGKYIFSGGSDGIWELFRPLIHPLLLGFWWYAGINPITAGKVMDLVFSLVDISLVYTIALYLFNRRVAFFSSLLFGLTGLFVMFSGFVLTEPLAIMFSLLAVYYLVNGKWGRKSMIIVGVFSGLSFLTKFPQAIVALGIGFGILFGAMKFKEKWKEAWRFGAGFLFVTLPYFIFNYVRYGDAFLPLREGSKIVATYTWLYESSWTYYLTDFFSYNLLYLFFLAGLYYFVKEKGYNQTSVVVLVVIPILFFFYFETVPRKELRYLVTALPFLAIVSGYGIWRVYEILRKSSKPIIKPLAFMALCGVLLLLFLPYSLSFERPPSFELEIMSLIEEYNITGTILTSDPAFVSFLSNRVKTLDGIEFAPTIYEWERKKYQLLFVNSCDLLCPTNNQSCLQTRENLFGRINRENTEMFKKQFKNCTYTIYLPVERKD